MKTDKTGGPAFPVATDFSKVNEGMTLRDWFAGQVLAAMHSNPNEQTWPPSAEYAYEIADIMLAERKRKYD
jgi:hypothetical protein